MKVRARQHETGEYWRARGPERRLWRNPAEIPPQIHLVWGRYGWRDQVHIGMREPANGVAELYYKVGMKARRGVRIEFTPYGCDYTGMDNQNESSSETEDG